MDPEDKEEMEQLVEMVIGMAEIAVDSMLEKGLPKKVAKLAAAYQAAFVGEGFSPEQSADMVKSVLTTQIFNTNKS